MARVHAAVCLLFLAAAALAQKGHLFDNGATSVTSTLYGPMMYPRNDVYIGAALKTYGEWSREEIGLMELLIKPGDVVVDGGANVGVFSLVMSRLVGDEGLVVAFEVQNAMFNMLAGNMALNNVMNAVLHHAGLSSEPSELAISKVDFGAGLNFGAYSLNADYGDVEHGRETVKLDALDNFLTADVLKGRTVSFIKLDIEGMELVALEGALRTIHRFQPLMLLEAQEEAVRNEALWRFLVSLDYECLWALTPMSMPGANFKGSTADLFAGVQHANMLCAPVSRNILDERAHFVNYDKPQAHPIAGHAQ